MALDMTASGSCYFDRAPSIISNGDPRPMSLAFWYKGPVVLGGSDYSYILNNSFGGNESLSVYLVNEGGGNATIRIYSIGLEYSSDSFAWNASAWNLIVITWATASNTLKIYLNGTLIKTLTATFGGIGDTNVAAIGTYDGADAAYHINGLLEDFRVYSRVISLSDVTAIYNSGLGGGADGVSTNLVCRYKLNGVPIGTSPLTIPDSAGGVSGAPHSSPVWRAGLLPSVSSGRNQGFNM